MEIRKFVEITNPIIAEEWIDGRSFTDMFVELHDVSSYPIDDKEYCIEMWVHDLDAGFTVRCDGKPEMVMVFPREGADEILTDGVDQNELVFEMIEDITVRNISPCAKYDLLKEETLENFKNEREKL